MVVSDQISETSINQQEVTMGSRKMLMTTAMVALLALPLAACSSTAKIRTARLCTAAGGTYNGGTKTCNPGTPNQKTAMQMCQSHGGVYDTVLDMCEMPGDK
jgi:ABC-type oligopeptide transport system substrate-binding subunit